MKSVAYLFGVALMMGTVVVLPVHALQYAWNQLIVYSWPLLPMLTFVQSWAILLTAGLIRNNWGSSQESSYDAVVKKYTEEKVWSDPALAALYTVSFAYMLGYAVAMLVITVLHNIM